MSAMIRHGVVIILRANMVRNDTYAIVANFDLVAVEQKLQQRIKGELLRGAGMIMRVGSMR